MEITTLHIYILSAFLFSIGLAIVLSRKNAIFVLMGIELMLNAANINFVLLGKTGQFFALFVIVIAAAEVAVALALILKIFHYFKTINLDHLDDIKR